MVGRKYAEALGLQMGNRVVSSYSNLQAAAPVEVKETEVGVKSVDF